MQTFVLEGDVFEDEEEEGMGRRASIAIVRGRFGWM